MLIAHRIRCQMALKEFDLSELLSAHLTAAFYLKLLYSVLLYFMNPSRLPALTHSSFSESSESSSAMNSGIHFPAPRESYDL